MFSLKKVSLNKITNHNNTFNNINKINILKQNQLYHEKVLLKFI